MSYEACEVKCDYCDQTVAIPEGIWYSRYKRTKKCRNRLVLAPLPENKMYTHHVCEDSEDDMYLVCCKGKIAITCKYCSYHFAIRTDEPSLTLNGQPFFGLSKVDKFVFDYLEELRSARENEKEMEEDLGNANKTALEATAKAEGLESKVKALETSLNLERKKRATLKSNHKRDLHAKQDECTALRNGLLQQATAFATVASMMSGQVPLQQRHDVESTGSQVVEEKAKEEKTKEFNDAAKAKTEKTREETKEETKAGTMEKEVRFNLTAEEKSETPMEDKTSGEGDDEEAASYSEMDQEFTDNKNGMSSSA